MFFNHFKFKRKLNRGVRTASEFVFPKAKARHKDFDWRKRKTNPFARETTDWRGRSKAIILAMTLLVMLGLALYHSFFYIREVKVVGLQRINEKEFKTAVLGIINYHKLFIFPAQNYFLADLGQLNDILKNRFPLMSIITKKEFPQTLSIQVEEKISTVIYDNGKKYYYLGTEGKIVEVLRQVGEDEWQEKKEVVTSTDAAGKKISETKILERIHRPPIKKVVAEMGDYPLVYDKQEKAEEINSAALPAETVQGIIDWFNLINKRTNIPFGYVIIDNEREEGMIITLEGWGLKVKLNNDIEKQFAELQYLLKEQKINRHNIQYIDLRFLGKVYWQ